MIKKSFQTAPSPKQPTVDQIAAFEQTGAGHDLEPSNVKIHKPSNVGLSDEPTKRLSLDLPQSVHKRFKTACSATDRKMTAEVMGFIEARTKELEAEAGIKR